MQTTIMAITFEGGVMLAADSRTSAGRFVANRTAAKITQIAKNIGICRSGSAADTQAVAAFAQYYLAHHQIELGSFTPVQVAATILQSVIYNNKSSLSCGLILGGWDEEAGGQVFAVPMGGTLLQVCMSFPSMLTLPADSTVVLAGGRQLYRCLDAWSRSCRCPMRLAGQGRAT